MSAIVVDVGAGQCVYLVLWFVVSVMLSPSMNTLLVAITLVCAIGMRF